MLSFTKLHEYNSYQRPDGGTREVYVYPLHIEVIRPIPHGTLLCMGHNDVYVSESMEDVVTAIEQTMIDNKKWLARP